jgi:cytochrome P450
MLIQTGGDTTSTAIGSTFFYLSRNTQAYTRLTREIRSTFSSLDSIRQGAALASCVYLRACVEEALRMSPPTPGSMWREVQPGGLSVAGAMSPILSGLEVGVGIYAIHHNPGYYPQPFKYLPERWIAGGDYSDGDVALAHSAFNPFSIGPRACIAKGFAYLEITLALARIIWQADFRVPEDRAARSVGEGRLGAEYGRHRIDEFQTLDQFTPETDGPMLEFRRRVSNARD